MLVQRHQTLFFSATINREIKKLAFSQVKSSAVRIQISPDDKVSKKISHFVVFVEMDDKRFFLEKFIKENQERRMIVFVRTRVRAERVAKAMGRAGITCATLHGEKDQADRTAVMAGFKAGECNVLIATDISARGIDVPNVPYVINYDLPDEARNYVHRVGRTGRGVHEGVAVSFCSKEEMPRLEEIQAFLNKKIEVLKMGKEDYALAVTSVRESDDPMALIREHEAWLQKKKKKK
jgi:ATP-dependent RNA helicase RhlE